MDQGETKPAPTEKRRESDERVYHAKEGLSFIRQMNGEVIVEKKERDGSTSTVTLDEYVWSSIVCQMSRGGEHDERFQAALEFHNSVGRVEVRAKA